MSKKSQKNTVNDTPKRNTLLRYFSPSGSSTKSANLLNKPVTTPNQSTSISKFFKK